MKDGGKRGPLQWLTFIQDNINQSSTHTRRLSSLLFSLTHEGIKRQIETDV